MGVARAGGAQLGCVSGTVAAVTSRFAFSASVRQSLLLQRCPATYQELVVHADMGAFVVSCGGFIHWLELKAQWHTRNSAACSFAT